MTLRDAVIAALIGHVPIADPGKACSGLAVSPNGRVVRLALFAADGGMGRPVAVWEAYQDLAIALLREAGFIVKVTQPCLAFEVSMPAAEVARCDAPTARCGVAS